MYVVLWRFRPREGRQSEFERAYGPSGEWALLFRRGDGYLGTELLQRSEDPREYLTLDRWTSRCLRSIPGSLERRVSAARPSVGRAHRGGDTSRHFRGATLRVRPAFHDIADTAQTLSL
jgi:hypothetical protein